MRGVPMTGPALVVGDTLVMGDGRELLISKLIPADGGDAIALGRREIFSGSWSMTVEGDEQVCVFPRHGVLYQPAEQDEQVAS